MAPNSTAAIPTHGLPWKQPPVIPAKAGAAVVSTCQEVQRFAARDRASFGHAFGPTAIVVALVQQLLVNLDGGGTPPVLTSLMYF
jgi:hypothetical protein